MNDLQQLASDVVKTATKSGATAADCVVREGNEFSATVRCNEVEQLKEAGAKGIGLRVFLGHRTASSYTSDFSPKGIERLVSSALSAARVTSEDPCAGLPEAEHVGSHPGELDLYHDDVSRLETSFMIDLARKTEQIAFDCDPRIRNSEGGTFESYRGRKILATSQGFLGVYRHSTCSLSVVPIAVPETDGEAGNLGCSAITGIASLAALPDWRRLTRLAGRQPSAHCEGSVPEKFPRAGFRLFSISSPPRVCCKTFLKPSTATPFTGARLFWLANWVKK